MGGPTGYPYKVHSEPGSVPYPRAWAKGFCGFSGQSGEMGQGCFILKLIPIRGYLSSRPGTDYWHHRLYLSTPNPRISVKRGSMARQVWEVPCVHHDRRWLSRRLKKGAWATSALHRWAGPVWTARPCVLTVGGRGAAAPAAVADGRTRRAQDEPGPGPGAGPLLPVPYPPVDQ